MSNGTRGAIGAVVALVCLLPLTVLGARPCEPAWTPGLFELPGVDGVIYAFAVFDDGNGPALYAGGHFHTATDLVTEGLARWDGERWSSVGGGTNAYVPAMTVFDDGTGPALYVGGIFTVPGSAGVTNLARWDGVRWTALPCGLDSDSLNALAVFDDGSGPALYAMGLFNWVDGVNQTRIARWDGTQWTAPGGGLGNYRCQANSLAVFDDGSGPALYMSGSLYDVLGVPFASLVKWDGTRWSVVGTGGINSLAGLTVFDDGSGPALYGTCRFLASASWQSGVGKWDGKGWSTMSTGTDEGVSRLAVCDDGSGPRLYAAVASAWYTTPASYGVKRWDGTQWSPLGTGMNFHVITLQSFDDGKGPALYAGGWFTYAGGVQADHIAKWDGTGWSALGSGSSVDFNVDAMVSIEERDGPSLYVGGYFIDNSGDVPTSRVFRWNGRQWFRVGGEMDGGVSALAAFNDGSGVALYAGGGFVTAGGTPVNYVAKWNGEQWVALDTGLSGRFSPSYVSALIVFDDGTGPALYVGGEFGGPAGVSASGFAKWDGSQWSMVGDGAMEFVTAMTVFDDGSGPNLFASGLFSDASGRARHVARWDGSRWLPLGGEFAGGSLDVLAIAAFKGELYVGGGFNTPTKYVAKWDGANWVGVGGAFPNSYYSFPTYVEALTTFDDGRGPALYVAGEFTTAGGLPVNNIMRWDGQGWSSVGGGMNREVMSLLSYDDGSGPALYAGGPFSIAGDVVSACIARWGCQTALADLNADGDVDMDDFERFRACFNGPNRMPKLTGCEDADIDSDADVDLVDFSRFRACFNGSNRGPACP